MLEFVGTALLLAAVVGSGIMAERLAGGNAALALLCNTLATAGALGALIAALSPLCGAHLNPIVTAAEALGGSRPWSEVLPYAAAQTLGAITGVALANAMFGEPLLFASHHARSGPAQLLSEAVATFGLVFVIFVCAKARPPAVPYVVAGYIGAAYWFTSSTSFANPAVTLARALSDTFAGIRPADVPGFVAAQLAGAALALAVVRYALSCSSPASKARARRSAANQHDAGDQKQRAQSFLPAHRANGDPEQPDVVEHERGEHLPGDDESENRGRTQPRNEPDGDGDVHQPVEPARPQPPVGADRRVHDDERLPGKGEYHHAA